MGQATQKHQMRKWPESLLSAVRQELQGNARRDLLGWAHRTIAAVEKRQNVSKSDVERARVVLDIEAGVL